MQLYYKKLVAIVFLSVSFIFLTALSSLDYTKKVDPLPNMPEGNPDPNLGIVVHPHSTGVDVLADSSKNIRFTASKNYYKTAIELLSSSSLVDRSPKKFKFLDKKHGFSSDNIYQFKMMFNDKNYQWEVITFMPFPSVIEWVTKEKLIIYLDQWSKIFEDAGWKNVSKHYNYTSLQKYNYTLPVPENRYRAQSCVWETQNYEASISVSLRSTKNYLSYVPKTERKKVKEIPDGYIVFIDIVNKSQYIP